MSTNGLTEGQKHWREEVASAIAVEVFGFLDNSATKIFDNPRALSGDKEPSDRKEFRRLVAAALVDRVKQEWGVL